MSMAPQRRTVATHCVLDCPDTCALTVTVSGEGAEARVESIQGDSSQSPTRGFICSKVSHFSRRLDHEDRLLFPQRRVGPKGSGRFERISWDDALGEIARRFREITARWGAEAILPYSYGGSNGYLGEGYVDQLFFTRLGATRIEKTLCAAPTTAVARQMYGKMPGVAYEDFVHARFILVWGANPKNSNIHLIPFLHEAREQGAFVAAVDPMKVFSDREVDLHLPVYPGADLPLALGMIEHWRQRGELDDAFLDAHADGLAPLLAAARQWPLERAAAAARVPAADLKRLADAYAGASPAVLRCGWGLERNRYGGRAAAAILAMPALLGKFGVRGGGYLMSNSGAVRPDPAKAPALPASSARTLNMSRLGEQLQDRRLSPPIQALFVYNCNPVATVPDQNAVLAGLAREDLFTVVYEQVRTDTALWADLLLPATTFLEQREIRGGYGSYVVGGIQPAIPPRGEARPNHQVFAELGRAFGFEDEVFHADEETLFHRTAESLRLGGGQLAGLPLDGVRLWRGEGLRPDFPGASPVQFETVFPATPDGRIQLTPPALGEDPYAWQSVEDAAHPLALITPAHSRLLSSTFGEWALGELTVTLHPEDARQRDVAPGDEVRVFNGLGEVHCRARLSDRLRPGVVLIPKGAWQKSAANGRTANALCPADPGLVASGACYNDARVEVRRR